MVWCYVYPQNTLFFWSKINQTLYPSLGNLTASIAIYVYRSSMYLYVLVTTILHMRHAHRNDWLLRRYYAICIFYVITRKITIYCA